MRVTQFRDSSTGEVQGLKIQEFGEETVFAARDYSGLTIKQTVELLMNIYSKSLKEFQSIRGVPEHTALENAARCWRAELPELIDRKSVLAYVACIAWGQRMGAISGSDAKLMMFMAQTQLTALKVPQPGGSVGKITGTGAAMVTHDTGAAAAPPLVFCQGCGNPVGPDVKEQLGDFCSVDCMSRKVRNEP